MREGNFYMRLYEDKEELKYTHILDISITMLLNLYIFNIMIIRAKVPKASYTH